MIVDLKTWVIALMMGAFLFSCQQAGGDKQAIEIDVENNEMQKISYSYGIYMANTIQNQGFDDIDFAAFEKGIKDKLGEKELLVKEEEIGQILQAYADKRRQEKVAENLAASEKFLEENKARDGVQVTESGLQYEILTEGEGDAPTATDKVSVHYHGTLPDGTVFDSSVDRGNPSQFAVNGVIAGWTEALQMMKVGSKWKLFVPPSIAYGERGAGGKIGPNQALIFEVELLEILSPEGK